MTSFGYRSNPRYAIKECSSYGTMYTRDCGCSKGNVEDKILVPKPLKNCARCTRCGYLVDGPNCQRCALLRQELEENLVIHSPDFQNTLELSNASTNIANAPREPYVVRQDNDSFSPVIHQPPQELSIQEMEDLKQQYLDELKHLSNLEYRDEWAYLSTYPSKRLTSFCFDDDDEDYTFAITPDEPVLSTKEPDNSLSMGDEHLDTILATKSDEFIKSGVKNLILIPSESEGIPERMCDVPTHDNSLPLNVSNDQIEDFFESNKEFSSIDDDSFSIDDIDYVEASPFDSELVSSEVMEIVIPEVGG
nr:hypothetical protein [Tanacetum cinerariifolium]